MNGLPDSPKPLTLLEEIAAHPFMRGLKVKHLDLLTECAMRTDFQKNQIIFREGDLANRFYLIQSGRVLLESRVGGEGPVLVQEIGGDDVLGWSWLFPPYYWHFDARAAEATKAIFFYGTRLRTQCEENLEFGHELLRRMAMMAIRRLQSSREQLARLCLAQR
jgi:CRP-like cAMP-binding protein